MLTLYFDKARLLAGFFILLTISGCANVPKISNNLTPIVELTDTPFFPQEDHQCGPAALATVLAYRGVNITPDELTPLVFLPERKGSLQIEVAATARRYQMLVYQLAPNLSDLLKEVAAGNPVLVLQNLAFNSLPQWHYAVVVGYDLDQSEIILRSGRHERWRSKLTTFSRTWQRSGNWALVILPPEKIPQTAKMEPFLKSALDLEATEKHKEALSAYRAATLRWPDDKHVWLALGNGALNLNFLEEAHFALKQAISLAPADSTAFNNLAYVYLAAGCPEQARESIHQALLLNPEDKNLLDSKQEIEANLPLVGKDGCRLAPATGFSFIPVLQFRTKSPKRVKPSTCQEPKQVTMDIHSKTADTKKPAITRA